MNNNYYLVESAKTESNISKEFHIFFIKKKIQFILQSPLISKKKDSHEVQPNALVHFTHSSFEQEKNLSTNSFDSILDTMDLN